MPSPLNRIPRGLLDYFGIKSGEWGPRELGQLLQPVLELRDWYANADALEVAATIPAGGIFVATVAAGTIALTNTTAVDLTVGGIVTVPQDQTWLILEAGTAWNYTANAGNAADVWWSVRGINMPMSLNGTVVSDAAAVRSGNRSLRRPMWARPGDTITLAHGGLIVAAGNVNVFACRLRLVRFQI